MNARILRLEFPNGEIFEVPTEIIAHHRTSYYAEADGFKEGSSDWNDEWGQSMKTDELRDWLMNNMDWEEIEPHAKKVSEVDHDYSEMWSEIEISFR